MSLEDKIDTLTAAVIALTDAMTPTGTQRDVAVKDEPKKDTPKATKAPAKKEEPKAVEGELVVSFEDLKQAVVAAADKDKEATKAALAKFKVAKISELKEEQYEGALEALKAVVSDEKPAKEDSFV